MSFFEFPYTRTYSSDLGWLIRHVKWLTDQVENKTIKYADPIAWNITSQYEMNTVVLDGTVAYLSKQAVPSGVGINNTDYWQPIFDIAPIIGDLSNLRDQISDHYEETYTASRNYAVGDWMFINDGSNDLLYYALAPITVNGGLVPDVTVKKATVEDLVISCMNEIAALDGRVGDLNDLATTDKTSIVNAINENVGNIGDLNNLTTIDKSSIVNAINVNAANIVNVAGYVTALDTKVGDLADLNTSDKTSVVNAINETLASAGKNVYNPSDAFNLDATGASDCAAILSGIADNVGFKAGSYLIDTNCTIACNMLFPEGAKLVISNGVTVTIKGFVSAGLYEIFTGSGFVRLEGNSEVYPEWFGAAHDLVTDDADAIQNAFNSIKAGAVILQAGKYNFYQNTVPVAGYYTSKTINIYDNQSDVSIKCLAGKAVIYSSANVCINIEGSTDNQATKFISNATIENIIIFYRGTVPTPSGYNQTIGLKIHGGIRNRTKNIEVYNYLTGIYSDTIVAHYIEGCTMHAPNKLYATNIYLNDDIINSAIYPNASFHVNGSIFFGAANTVGITAKGDILSDLFVRDNEFGGHYCAVSMAIDATGNSALDIHITDNIIDNCYRGIDINCNGIVNASSNIRGNWLACSGDFAIQLNRTNGSIISSNNIAGNLSSSITGIQAIYSHDLVITGNQILNCHKGIATNTSYYDSICSNEIIVDIAGTNGIELTSSTASNISNNTIRPLTNGNLNSAVTLTGSRNVVNWNMRPTTLAINVPTGNIVDGASI